MGAMKPSEAREGAPTSVRSREAFGWAMFDFANSSYTTVIITVVYAVVFPRLLVGDAPEFRRGNLLWSLSLALSYGLVVLLAPFVGALMDVRAAKKRVLFATYLLTVIGSFGLYFAAPGNVGLAMALVIASNVAFSLGESCAAAFLPDLGPPEALGRISGYAWGLGYVGGLLSTAIVLAFVGPQTLDNFERVRLVGPITGVFFGLGAIPTFLLLREHGTRVALPEGESLFRMGVSRVRHTLKSLDEFRDFAVFLVAFFFAMAGLGIVIAFAFIYGDQIIQWSPKTQAAMFVLTQITATFGAIAFGRIQSRLGDLPTFLVTLAVWIAVSLLVAGTPTIAARVGTDVETTFLAIGGLAGLCLGATQSAGRTIVASFSPAGREGEFAGFWGLSAKLAQMTGLVVLGFLQDRLGLARAILVCGLFFALAFAVGLRVDTRRGRAVASAAQ